MAGANLIPIPGWLDSSTQRTIMTCLYGGMESGPSATMFTGEKDVSLYKYLLEENNHKMAFELFRESQEKYQRGANGIMFFAPVGGLVLLGFITSYYGKAVAEMCGIVGMVWYVLGFFYCQLLWNKEKDNTEFTEALREYDKKHTPSQDA